MRSTLLLTAEKLQTSTRRGNHKKNANTHRQRDPFRPHESSCVVLFASSRRPPDPFCCSYYQHWHSSLPLLAHCPHQLPVAAAATAVARLQHQRRERDVVAVTVASVAAVAVGRAFGSVLLALVLRCDLCASLPRRLLFLR